VSERRPTAPWEAFGRYVRSQRQLAQLSLRQLADLARVSNPYLSQIERGLHQPSVAVITALAEALDLSAEQLLAQAAGLRGTGSERVGPGTEAAIRADPRLGEAQKAALLAVYRSMVDQESVDQESVDQESTEAPGSAPAAGRAEPTAEGPPTG
jgi:transcriptional regulator with XRE-family HTH domain